MWINAKFRIKKKKTKFFIVKDTRAGLTIGGRDLGRNQIYASVAWKNIHADQNIPRVTK